MTDGWRELYDTEYPRLLRALLAIGGDPDAAEDAAQEAFVKAHKQGLVTLERPGAWLLVVGTRELFRQRRRRRVGAERWAEARPSGGPPIGRGRGPRRSPGGAEAAPRAPADDRRGPLLLRPQLRRHREP